MKLKIIVATTRPGRKGPVIGEWIFRIAQHYKEFEVELLDLAKINLPFLDEPKHPRFQEYTKEHTKEWSKKISEGDAFIIVTAEYNHGYPAPLKNALDFVYKEWNNKPVAFVSYGGVAGGTRAVQQLKPIVLALKMIPIVEGVVLPNFEQYIDEKLQKFNATEMHQKSAEAMMKELIRWATKLSGF